MGKGLDGKFINYGIRQDDLMLISTLCEKHQVDFDWLKEEILRKFHAARVDKIEMSDADTQTIYGNLSKEGLKVNIDDGKSIERLKDANGDPIKFKTPAAALMYFLSEGWNLYINGRQQRDIVIKEQEDLYLLHNGFSENLVQKKSLRKL